MVQCVRYNNTIVYFMGDIDMATPMSNNVAAGHKLRRDEWRRKAAYLKLKRQDTIKGFKKRYFVFVHRHRHEKFLVL